VRAASCGVSTLSGLPRSRGYAPRARPGHPRVTLASSARRFRVPARPPRWAGRLRRLRQRAWGFPGCGLRRSLDGPEQHAQRLGSVSLSGHFCSRTLVRVLLQYETKMAFGVSGEHRPGPRGDRPPGVPVVPAVADSYDRAVRPLTRLTGVPTVTSTVHCLACVWVNESRPRMWPLRRLLVRAEVAA
jgi:hypothetical protein